MCFHLVIIMRCWEQTAHDTVWSGDVMTVYSLQTSPSSHLSLIAPSLFASKLHHCSLGGILHFTQYYNIFHENCFTFSVKMCGAKHQMSRLTDWPNYNVNKYNVINKCGNIFIIGPQFTVYSL